MSIAFTLDGTTYASIAECARENGLPYITLYRVAADRGLTSRRERPLEIHGVKYPSQAAAAKALGMSKSYISHACRTGRLHRVGCRKKKGPRA